MEEKQTTDRPLPLARVGMRVELDADYDGEGTIVELSPTHAIVQTAAGAEAFYNQTGARLAIEWPHVRLLGARPDLSGRADPTPGLLFEVEDDKPVPVPSHRADGSARAADGETILTVEQAADRFGVSADSLAARWRAVWEFVGEGIAGGAAVAGIDRGGPPRRDVPASMQEHVEWILNDYGNPGRMLYGLIAALNDDGYEAVAAASAILWQHLTGRLKIDQDEAVREFYKAWDVVGRIPGMPPVPPVARRDGPREAEAVPVAGPAQSADENRAAELRAEMHAEREAEARRTAALVELLGPAADGMPFLHQTLSNRLILGMLRRQGEDKGTLLALGGALWHWQFLSFAERDKAEVAFAVASDAVELADGEGFAVRETRLPRSATDALAAAGVPVPAAIDWLREAFRTCEPKVTPPRPQSTRTGAPRRQTDGAPKRRRKSAPSSPADRSPTP